jgi:hypothetical protein
MQKTDATIAGFCKELGITTPFNSSSLSEVEGRVRLRSPQGDKNGDKKELPCVGDN